MPRSGCRPRAGPAAPTRAPERVGVARRVEPSGVEPRVERRGIALDVPAAAAAIEDRRAGAEAKLGTGALDDRLGAGLGGRAPAGGLPSPRETRRTGRLPRARRAGARTPACVRLGAPALGEHVDGARAGDRADRQLGVVRVARWARAPANRAPSASASGSGCSTAVWAWSASRITAFAARNSSRPPAASASSAKAASARAIDSICASGPNLCEWWSLSGSEKSRKS